MTAGGIPTPRPDLFKPTILFRWVWARDAPRGWPHSEHAYRRMPSVCGLTRVLMENAYVATNIWQLFLGARLSRNRTCTWGRTIYLFVVAQAARKHTNTWQGTTTLSSSEHERCVYTFVHTINQSKYKYVLVVYPSVTSSIILSHTIGLW